MISYNDVVNTLSSKDDLESSLLEEEIDLLLKDFNGYQVVFDLIKSRKQKIQNKLIKRYTNGGWTVIQNKLIKSYTNGGWTVIQVSGDKREPGSSLIFSAPVVADHCDKD